MQFDELHGQEILHVLLDTNLFSLCLHCIRHGDTQIQKVRPSYSFLFFENMNRLYLINEKSVTSVQAATLILMKILMQEDGLKYCCAYPDDFQSLIQVLRQLVEETFTFEIPCPQHLKYVIQCYLCISRVAREDG